MSLLYLSTAIAYTNRPQLPFNFANSNTLYSNSGAIPEARSSVPVTWKHGVQIVVVQRLVVRASSSRFILGWICATSATPRLDFHSISRITESTIVCHSPRQTLSLSYSSFRVHFTRGNSHLPLRVDRLKGSVGNSPNRHQSPTDGLGVSASVIM